MSRPALGTTAEGMNLLVFSHDLHDARFHKRLRTFADLGFDVRWLAYDRDRQAHSATEFLAGVPGEVIGKAHDAQYLQRILGMALSLVRLLQRRFLSADTSVIYCINLDNLLLAIVANILRRLRCKVVYEVADIQPVLLRRGKLGQLLRRLERWCLKRTNLVVYTSACYLSEFLEREQGYRGSSLLLENKIYPAPEQALRQRDRTAINHLVIGVFGQFKCRRTFEMIQQLAAEFPDKVKFLLRGYPNDILGSSLEQLVSARTNITYGGPYKYPADLSEIYSTVDLCWGFDFCSPGANSKWTLANRLYEAGYFGVPILVEADTAGGDYVRRIGSGWVLEQPLQESLKEFLSRITVQEVQARKDHILQLDRKLFLLDSDLPKLRREFAHMVGQPGMKN
jgi:succinoglycan biosynthesis protein ExoL